MSAYSPACDYNHPISVAACHNFTSYVEPFSIAITLFKMLKGSCHTVASTHFKEIQVVNSSIKQEVIQLVQSLQLDGLTYTCSRWACGCESKRHQHTMYIHTYTRAVVPTITHCYDCVMSKNQHGTMPSVMYH